MIRILVVAVVALAGIALLLDADSRVAGVVLLVLGAAIANGARHGLWVSWYLDDPDGDSSDDSDAGWGDDADDGGDD